MSPDVNLSGIPERLREYDQWICWRETERNGRVTKLPVRPDGSGQLAKANDPETWGSFIEALERSRRSDDLGLGFVFSESDPFVGLDLDNAIDAEGNLKEWVPRLFDGGGWGPWAERSPSGSGVHIIAIGERPDWWVNLEIERDGDEHEGVEVYDSGRFFTVTGDVLESSASDVRDDWDSEPWLRSAHESIEGPQTHTDESDGSNGQSPTEESERSESASDGSDGDGGRGGERTDVSIDVRSVIGSQYETGVRFAHPVHGSSTGSNFMVDDGGETWRCWRHDTTGNALHMIGLQEDVLGCGEWESGALDSETWREIFDAGRERGLIPEETDPDYVPTPAELIARYSDRYDAAEDVPPDALAAFDALDGETPPEEDERPQDTPTGRESGLTWDGVYQMYRWADDADDRQAARWNALRCVRERDAWATVRESDTLYHYDPRTGIYTPYGDSVLRERLVQGLQENFTAHELKEIETSIRGLTTVGSDEMGGPTGKVAAKNGVIDLETGELGEHSPEYRFLAALGTEFEPDAEAELWVEFLQDVVPTEDERLKLQEYAGYCLAHGEMQYHKALFLVGPTASGKSTFLDTIRAMIGEESVSSLTPQEIISERFGGAELFGKLANIRNDIPADTIDNVGKFKEVTAGDAVKAERKYRDPFYFNPTTKYLFSGNQLPDTTIDDEAFYRRILLVPFPVTIPEERRDLHLDDKLQAELPGVLNWAIEGLHRLREQGRFTGDRDPSLTEETWRRWGNPVGRFADECLAKVLGDRAIPTAELYSTFVRYCAEENVPSVSHNKMTQKLKQEGYEYGRVNKDGGRKRAILGVTLTGRGEAIRDRDLTGAGETNPTERGLGRWEE